MLDRVAAEAATRFDDQPAFVMADDPQRRVTYRGLDRLSDEVAAGLAARGVEPGDVVALALPPCIEYPIAYLAAAKLGAVTAGINTRLTEPERRTLLDRVTPRIVIGDVEDPAGVGDDHRSVLVHTRGGPLLEPLRRGVASSSTTPGPALDPHRPLAICFTSGTTGPPKAAVFGGRQLDAITSIDVGDRWGGGGVSLATTSFAHLGPMTKLPGMLRRGGTAHVMRRWHPSEALDLIERHGVSSVGGIPTQIAMLLDSPGFADRDLRSIRLVVMGGGPATPTLIRRARDGFDAPVCVRYSCTEAGIGLGTAPDDPPEDAEVSVGRPHHGVELAIRSDGQDLPPGEVGEVLLRSPACMSGYLDDLQATAAAFTDDGYVRTGDLGYVDDHGRLRLSGRSSERYVRGGYNVHPQEIERILAEHAAVRDVAIVGVADEVYGEIGVAFVVPERFSDAPSLTELREYAGGRLARHKLPEGLRLVDELPLTAGHKVDRRRLRSRITGSQEPDAAAQPVSPG